MSTGFLRLLATHRVDSARSLWSDQHRPEEKSGCQRPADPGTLSLAAVDFCAFLPSRRTAVHLRGLICRCCTWLQARWLHCPARDVSCPHPELEMENEINFGVFPPEIKAMRRSSAISK